MINAYQLLWAKQSDLVRVRKEVESLRIVATLLSETDEMEALERDVDGHTVVQLDGSDHDENADHDESFFDHTALPVQLKKQNSRESSRKARMFRNWLGRSAGEWTQRLWPTTSSDDSSCVGVNK